MRNNDHYRQKQYSNFSEHKDNHLVIHHTGTDNDDNLITITIMLMMIILLITMMVTMARMSMVIVIS